MADTSDGSKAVISRDSDVINDVIAEHAETVRGEARYFVVAATDAGVIQAVIYRDSDQGKKDHCRDAWAYASVYDPTREKSWRWVASLGYMEMSSRDMPCHGELDDWMNRLRADADAVLERAVAILTAVQSQDGPAS